MGKKEESKRMENGDKDDETIYVTTNVAVPPDGGWGWVVVAASFVSNLVIDGIAYSFGMFLTEIATSLNQTQAKVSLVGSLLAGSYLICGPFASALANKYGFRLVAIIGSVLGFVAFMLSSHATNVEYLSFTYGVIGGIAFGLIFVPSVITVGFYFEKLRGLATGIAVCGTGIGTFVMAPVSAWLIRQYTWRGALSIQACMILSCALYGMMYRPLKQVAVSVPVKEKPKGRQPLLLHKKINDMKSESGINIYKDGGIPEDGTPDMSFLNNNNKYPVASVIFNSKNNNKSSQSLNMSTTMNKDLQNVKFNPEGKNGRARRVLAKHSSLGYHYNSELSFGNDDMRCRSSSLSTANRKEFTNRPLYRDDIFLSSDLTKLPQYRSQPSALDYTMSVTRFPTCDDVVEKNKKYVLCSEAVRRALGTMLDISLLKSFTFLSLAISGFVTSMGLYVPFMYVNARALSYEIDGTRAVWLMSALGISNTAGRIGFGLLSTIPDVNAITLNNIAITLCGISTVLSGWSSTFHFQMAYVIVFGLTMASFPALRTIIVVQLLGLEKLTNAYGILLLFQGVAAIIGPPIAGFFLDISGDYNLSFYMSGLFIVLSAVICYPIERLSRWEKRRTEAKKMVELL